ncbi:MAG: hypothetical protein RIT02_2535, partial [Planctomycetota bacterium]
MSQRYFALVAFSLGLIFLGAH